MRASKMMAGYQPNAKKNFCKDCAHFHAASGSCSEVQGGISPDATCTQYFEPKKAPVGKKGR